MVDLSHIQPRGLQCSTNETAHEINRSMVLELIRLHGAVSRAELARLTGLQKSTVSIIADRLIDYGWIREYTARSGIRADQGGRGRKPAHLAVDDSLAVIAMDITPRSAAIAATDLCGRTLSRESFPMPGTQQEAEHTLAEAATAIMAQHSQLVFQGIGISVPGRINAETGILQFAPDIPWPNWEIKTSLSKRLALPAYACNATEAIVLSERWFGAFRKVQDALVISVSESIGVGVLTGGRDLLGTHGMAGEFGHVVLEADGPACGCGKRGCWETLASNRAIEQLYIETISRSRSKAHGKTYAEILALAERGDPDCQSVIEAQYRRIGEGLKLVLPFVPEMILFAGDFAALWKKFGHIIRELAERHARPMKAPELMTTSEDTATRLRGTTALVLQSAYKKGVKSTLRLRRRRG